MPTLTLYTRAGCHLCDMAKDVLEAVRAEVPFALELVDIDTDPVLVERYGMEIPVITIDGRKAFKYRVDPVELRTRLAHAAAGRYAPVAGEPEEGA